jgi:LPS O-antigen subunit length determinant protein (WzzB/FepE family)
MSPQISSARVREESELDRPEEKVEAAELQLQPAPHDEQADEERMALEVQIAEAQIDQPPAPPLKRGSRSGGGTVLLLIVIAVIGLVIGFVGVMML